MKIIILGSGGPAGRHLADCFDPSEVIAIDVNPLALRFVDAGSKVIMPGGATDEQFLSIINALPAGWVHAQADGEIPRLARLSGRLVGHRVFLPNEAAVMRCQDKEATRLALPERYRPTRGVDTPWPRWLRCRHGAGGRGARKVWDAEELAFFWKKTDKPMVSEYLPGANYGVDLVFGRGCGTPLVYAKQRMGYDLACKDIESGGQSAVSVCVGDEDVIKAAIDSVYAVVPNPVGVFGVDMKRDLGGELKVTEINVGRFLTGSLAMFSLTGFNLPRAAYGMATGAPPYPLGAPPVGVAVVRVMDTQPVIFEWGKRT